jgi:hypothetical protein
MIFLAKADTEENDFEKKSLKLLKQCQICKNFKIKFDEKIKFNYEISIKKF